MNTNMNELSLDEMKEVNAGLCSLAIAAVVVGISAVVVRAVDVGYNLLKGQ